MDVSEPTARKAMNELRGAGLVMQERRGQGKSNRYHLLVRPKDSFVQDQNVERVEEHEEKEHQEIPFEDSIAKLSIVVSLEARETTKQPSAHDSSSLPLPPPQLDEARMAIFPYMKDIGREMHDEASLTSTVTRTVRIFHRSGVSLEAFQMHLLLARQKTQERSASIKKVGANGMKNKVPYWFKVLETSLGLVDSPQSSDFSSSPYPRSQSGTAYFTANHTNPMVQGTRDFWNDRE
jgi:DNA-binding transcriptional ArsR family regulator